MQEMLKKKFENDFNVVPTSKADITIQEYSAIIQNMKTAFQSVTDSVTGF